MCKTPPSELMHFFFRFFPFLAMVPQSSQRRKFAGLAGCWAFGAAPSSRGSKRQLYCCCLFHFLGSKTSHCSPAASSNSGSASHAHRIAPAGSTLRASRERLSVSPSATRATRPVAQTSVGSLVSLFMYFQSTSSLLPISAWSKAGASLGCRRSTVSQTPASTRRCFSSSALARSSSVEKRALRSMASASALTEPSWPRSVTL